MMTKRLRTIGLAMAMTGLVAVPGTSLAQGEAECSAVVPGVGLVEGTPGQVVGGFAQQKFGQMSLVGHLAMTAAQSEGPYPSAGLPAIPGPGAGPEAQFILGTFCGLGSFEIP